MLLTSCRQTDFPTGKQLKAIFVSRIKLNYISLFNLNANPTQAQLMLLSDRAEVRVKALFFYWSYALSVKLAVRAFAGPGLLAHRFAADSILAGFTNTAL